MKFHPYSEVFPLLDPERQTELIEDIKAFGLREALWIYKGQILDGRNRFLACQKAKVKPTYRAFKGTDQGALALVISANLQRRQLNESQRAMAAARIATLRSGQRSDEVSGVPIGTAAQMAGASERSTKRARKVLDKGSKPLQQAVDSGEVSVSRAAAVTQLPKAEQLRAAQQPEPAPITTVREDWQPDIDEDELLAATEKELAASTDKWLQASDKLAAAQAEIKRQAAEIAVLKVSLNGYMNQCGEQVRRIKAMQRRLDKLEPKAA